MVSVDYQKLDMLLQSRRISRRQLAIDTGLSVDSLSASFRRHSRMKTDTLWRIAACLSVQAGSLIDRAGYESEDDYQADLKAVENGKSDYTVMVEDEQILELLRRLRLLNASGLDKVLSLVELVSEVPKYQKTHNEIIADQLRTEEKYLQMERSEAFDEIKAEREAAHEEAPFWREDS